LNLFQTELTKTFATVNVAATEDDTFLWLKLFPALFVLIAGHRFIAVRLAVCRVWMQRLTEVHILDGEYVERERLTDVFNAALKSAQHEMVMLYGQRGTGKSSVIRSCLKNRRGVISI
jgi:hypothetical protein